MGCTSCEQRATRRAADDGSASLLNATDITVVDHGSVRQLDQSDWPADKHKLVVFFPQTFTPVCATELGAIRKWASAFDELDCVLIAACTDSPEVVRSWYEQEPMLSDLDVLTFSTYLLPLRLNLIDGGRAKRSSVFFMQDGSVVKQEHFDKVGRSFAELHRMMYGYSTGSYCAEGWTNPSDGFLEKKQ